MRKRCNNPNAISYKNYGAKGIKVCDEWNEFSNFCYWSLDSGYIEQHDMKRGDMLSIDRIDSNKDYCPENCRWIPQRENARRSAMGGNDKRRKYIYYGLSPDGKVYEFLNITDFAKEFGLDVEAINKTAKGKYKTHRKWKFKRKENNQY